MPRSTSTRSRAWAAAARALPPSRIAPRRKPPPTSPTIFRKCTECRYSVQSSPCKHLNSNSGTYSSELAPKVTPLTPNRVPLKRSVLLRLIPKAQPPSLPSSSSDPTHLFFTLSLFIILSTPARLFYEPISFNLLDYFTSTQ